MTSVVMQTLERLVLQFLKSIIDPLLDQFQFAYRNNRPVDDAVALGLFYVLQHIDSPNAYARIPFVDFRSAFNTIIPSTLFDKIQSLSVPQSICLWILHFLLNRPQVVKIGDNLSSSVTISTGTPQGCVLSPQEAQECELFFRFIFVERLTIFYQVCSVSHTTIGHQTKDVVSLTVLMCLTEQRTQRS